MSELREHATVDDLDYWRTRAEELQAALDSRIVIEQAKGMIAYMLGVDIGQAFEILRRSARSSRRNIHAVAADVIESRTLPSVRARPPIRQFGP
jgi:AmiR/NasT family two-component response regulator